MRFILLFFVLISFSCHDNKGYVNKDENEGDEVYSVEGDDKQMNLAILEAKKTYPDFIKILESGDTTCSDFSVKMKFEYGENDAEHMWLNNFYLREGMLFGILDSDPVYVTSVKSGDTLQVDKNKISDWMYIRDNKLEGGYTIKALYNKMNKQEKKEFREQVGFIIE